MKVSELIGYARSQANIASSGAISHDDEDKPINLSWKNIYGRLIERDDDYFTAPSVTFSNLTPYATANQYEYMIPLPSNFYRLRFVDYQPGSSGGGVWSQMHKFPLSMRNDQPSEPHYRFDSTNLWVVGANVSVVRIHFYPPPAVLTHPDVDLVYGTSYAVGNFGLITSPVYALPYDTMAYVYNGLNIVAESQKNNTVIAPVTLATQLATITNLIYYKGSFFWIQGGNIYKMATDLQTAGFGAPGAIISTTTVTSLSVFMNKLYYCDAGVLKTATLAGGSVTQILAASGSWLSLCQGIVFYVSGTGTLNSVSPVTTNLIPGYTMTSLTSDGTNLYALDSTLQLHILTILLTAGTPSISADSVLRGDVLSIGPWAGGDVVPGTPSPNQRIPVILSEAQQLIAASSYADSNITYPANIVTEIMSVEAAIDFCIKLGKDYSGLKIKLGDPNLVPATGLWAQFKNLSKRDDYEPERIKNSRSGGWLGLGF